MYVCMVYTYAGSQPRDLVTSLFLLVAHERPQDMPEDFVSWHILTTRFIYYLRVCIRTM